MRVHALAPVVAIDLDGTVGAYHDHFVWFVNTIYFPKGKRYYPDWSRAGGTSEFSRALGMDKGQYRDAKLAYRQGGLKRCMPRLDTDLLQCIQAIRSMGIQIWVTTNRPWMRLDNVDPDTRYWIGHNMGTVDGIIFSQSKYHDLIDNVGTSRILGVIDDLPEVILEGARLGLNTAIRVGEHNAKFTNGDFSPYGMLRVHNMESFVFIVKQWKEKLDAQHPGVL